MKKCFEAYCVQAYQFMICWNEALLNSERIAVFYQRPLNARYCGHKKTSQYWKVFL
jgi:hypothetical protein